MTSNLFINTLISKVPDSALSADEQKKIQFEGIERFILSKLTSAKFKAASLPPEFEKKVKEKIHYCVSNNLPIHITVPFGGYKKWQLPTAPNADWAEVFNFLLLRDYLSPISKAYPNGVLLEYFSDEIFIPRMNNYPQEDVDSYNRQVETLLGILKNYLPENFALKYSRISDFISQEEILRRFESSFPLLREDFEKLPPAIKEAKVNKTERNYQGDLRSLSPEKKAEVLTDSYLIHEAFINSDWDTNIPWAFDTDMIALGFCYTGSWGIHLRSSPSSTVQFWIGLGALRRRGDTFLPTILTYNQYSEAKDKLNYEKIEFFPKGLPSLQEVPIIS